MENKDLRNYTKLNVYLNRATDVLRNKFKVEWNAKYSEEWNDTSGQKINDILGLNYVKRMGKIQRNYINSGNIDKWDISLLKQLLLNKHLFSLTTSDRKNIKELGDIRNNISHYGSQNVPINEFEAYSKVVFNALIALGDNEDELKKLECDDSIGGIQFSSDDVINDENTIEAKALKELGNKEFLCENYDKAIKHYTRAILLAGLPSTDRAMLYSNRCVCYFKLNDFENANKDSKDIVKLWPQWWRGYYRKAQIYNAINKYESLTKAEKCLIKAEAFGQKIEITELLNEVRQKIGPIKNHAFLDYRTHITSNEDYVDNYNKMTGLNLNVNAIKESEKPMVEFDNPMFKNSEDCMRGRKYLFGTDGFPLDYQSAAQCFAKAANRGSALGLYNLALMFREGKGVKQDFDLSLKYLLKATEQPPYIDVGHMEIANLGVAEAENALGLCYHKGICVEKDLLKAIEWYEKGVDHGCSTSANNLGLIYMRGEGIINRDLDKAEQLLKFDATKVDPNAMINMVQLYILKNDPEMALEWCKRVRNKGYDYPDLDNLETSAKMRLSELEKTFKDISEHENMDNVKSELTLKEKLFQKLSETSPQELNVFQQLSEIKECCFNKSKSPVINIEEMNSYKTKFDDKTLEKYANSGKLYAKKLLTAKTHFRNAMNVLFSIKNLNKPSSDECRNFIKHLSQCVQIETIVAFLIEPIERLVSFALNNNTDYDEDARICYAFIKFKDVEANIIFLNQCLKLYPKNVFFLETRGNMFAFRGNFEKSIQYFNKALKLTPNDYELLNLKATAMSYLKNIDYDQVIDAFNKFLSIAPEDHRQIPACYYAMADLNLNRDSNEAQRYYNMGLNAEEKQLSFFLPYDFPIKIKVELFLKSMRNENIAIPSKEDKSKNNPLTNPYRIQIIKNHREDIKKFNELDKKIDFYRNQNALIIEQKNSHKPIKIQRCAQSLAGMKSICLRDMDPTTDKIYDKCVIEFKVIDIVGTTGSSLVLVVEDKNKDVERCYIYNTPLLNDIKEANKLYGIGCQFSVTNPYLRIAADMKPAIRIDINSIVMRDFIRDMCRYCCEPNATKVCGRCEKAIYCS